MKTPTDEQLNLALCKWIGWTHYYEDLWVPPNTTDFSELDCSSLPNYLSDDSPRRLLNEAEARLTDKQHDCFRGYLFKLVDAYEAELPHVMWGSREYVSATASRRAEAFLRTLNLWNPET